MTRREVESGPDFPYQGGMAHVPSSRSRTSFRLESTEARVHVYTYHYTYPSMQARKPGRDLLVLFPEQHYGAAACYQVGEVTSRVLPVGNVMLVPAAAAVNAVGAGGALRIVACSMRGGILPTDFDATNPEQLALCNDIADRNIKMMMRRLALEAISPGMQAEDLLDALARTIRIDVARYFHANERSVTGVLAKWQVKRIEEYVEKNLGADLGIARLAGIVQISPGHLMRSFRQTMGMTVHQYVTQRRMDRACYLLSETRVPLKKMATDLGYGTPSSFTYAFRKAMGTTPARYRASNS